MLGVGRLEGLFFTRGAFLYPGSSGHQCNAMAAILSSVLLMKRDKSPIAWQMFSTNGATGTADHLMGVVVLLPLKPEVDVNTFSDESQITGSDFCLYPCFPSISSANSVSVFLDTHSALFTRVYPVTASSSSSSSTSSSSSAFSSFSIVDINMNNDIVVVVVVVVD